mmetsp:Transcript_5327/g.10958  ORF Transcript_5327/g.10958 Transcript_5327/m.10958 type:complete len:89 (-) Transcript_5327:32-298(-)
MASFNSPGSGDGESKFGIDTELRSFVEQENQKAAIQSAIAKLTELCWDKCVGKPGTRLSGYEEDCLGNCAARYLDASVFVMQRMMKKA